MKKIKELIKKMWKHSEVAIQFIKLLNAIMDLLKHFL